MLPDREIHVVDSLGASMAEGILARMGVELAAEGRSAAEIAEILEARAPDMRMYVALETLEYLKKGGRISGAQAAIGTLLSVKPIIGVKHGVVDTADRVRTRSQGPRAAHRAHQRAADRAAGDPAHDQPGRRGVPRRGLCPGAGGSTRPTSRSARRRVGRAAPRPGLRRRGDPVSDLSAPGQAPSSRCRRSRHVAARLRQPCRPVPSRRRESPVDGYTRATDQAARSLGIGSDRDRRRAPWGRPGDDPNRPAVDRPPDTEDLLP